MPVRLSRLGFLLLALSSLACGQRAPGSPSAWLDLAAEHFENQGFAAKFEMRFSLIENGAQIDTLHKGEIRGFDADHFQVQTRSRLRSPALGSQKIVIDTLVTADGTTLWAQSSYGKNNPPVVVKLPLAQSDALVRVDETHGNQLGPRDLDPLLLWRMAAQYCTFTEGAVTAPGYVVLIGEATPAFHEAAAHRSIFFRPNVVRLTMERSTGKPAALELLSNANKATLETVYSVWRELDSGIDDFGYTPPEGVQVVEQALNIVQDYVPDRD